MSFDYCRLSENKVYIIAEMSANHAGKLENALEIVRFAAKAEADCVKIQTYTADTMTIDCDKDDFLIKGGLWDGYKLYDLYNEAHTPWEWHKPIKEECAKCGVDFLSTPFDKTAVDFLEDLGVCFYKIASFELVDIPLIEYAASKGKPMLISCGMGSVEEIQEAVEACYKVGNNQIVLLKCCSEYPANLEDMKLANIKDMQERFKDCVIGFSDHSMGSLAPVIAASLGAKVIEKHVCLSRDIKNPDSDFSMEIDEFAQMVKDVRNTATIIGNVSYDLTEHEKKSTVFRRSIYAVKEIKKDDKFTEENIAVIRPGFGQEPKHYMQLLGCVSKENIAFGDSIQKGYLQAKPEFKLYADKYLIRSMVLDDAEILVKWRSNQELIKYFYNPTPLTKESHLKWYHTIYLSDLNQYHFIIMSDDVPVGFLNLLHIDYEKGSCEIGYAICESDFSKKGIASKAAIKLMDFAHKKWNINIFYAGIHKENKSSKIYVTRLGFREDGMIDNTFVRYVKTK